jgi:hypothetical protein
LQYARLDLRLRQSFGVGQIGPRQHGAIEQRAAQIGRMEIGAAQRRFGEQGELHFRFRQTCVFEARGNEICAPETRAVHFDPAQVQPGESSARQVGRGEICAVASAPFRFEVKPVFCRDLGGQRAGW